MKNRRLGRAVGAMTIIRLFFPLAVFEWPIWGTFFAFFFDGVDYEVLRYFGMKRPAYQLYDKYLDFYWYMLVLLFLLLQPLPVWQRNFFIFLFGLRLIGELGLIITKSERFLIFFPNFFELFFWFWLFVPSWISTPTKIWTALGICLVPKVAHECLVHATTFSTLGFVKKILGVSK